MLARSCVRVCVQVYVRASARVSACVRALRARVLIRTCADMTHYCLGSRCAGDVTDTTVRRLGAASGDGQRYHHGHWRRQQTAQVDRRTHCQVSEQLRSAEDGTITISGVGYRGAIR